MSSKITHISSQSHLNRLLSTNNYIVVDFHADWCGPCKAIAPVFDALATAHAKPGKLAFVKVDVDAVQEVAKKFGVSAMPTFMVLKREDTVVNSLRGADPAALRRMITDAAALADKSVSQSFATTGHVLGSAPATAASPTAAGRKTTAGATAATSSSSQRSGISLPTGLRLGDSWYTGLIRFAMLYVTTLFSLDPVASAMASPYRRNQ